MKTFFVWNMLAALGLCAAPAAADLVPPRAAEVDVPFVEIEARAFGRPVGETRAVLTSAEAYRSMLGSAPPPDLDFRRESVVFYAAGEKPTGGYEAHIGRVTLRDDGRLVIETKLISPGPRCFVTEVITHPYVVARFARPPEPRRAAFVHVAEPRDCPPM